MAAHETVEYCFTTDPLWALDAVDCTSCGIELNVERLCHIREGPLPTRISIFLYPSSEAGGDGELDERTDAAHFIRMGVGGSEKPSSTEPADARYVEEQTADRRTTPVNSDGSQAPHSLLDSPGQAPAATPPHLAKEDEECAAPDDRARPATDDADATEREITCKEQRIAELYVILGQSGDPVAVTGCASPAVPAGDRMPGFDPCDSASKRVSDDRTCVVVTSSSPEPDPKVGGLAVAARLPTSGRADGGSRGPLRATQPGNGVLDSAGADSILSASSGVPSFAETRAKFLRLTPSSAIVPEDLCIPGHVRQKSVAARAGRSRVAASLSAPAARRDTSLGTKDKVLHAEDKKEFPQEQVMQKRSQVSGISTRIRYGSLYNLSGNRRILEEMEEQIQREKEYRSRYLSQRLPSRSNNEKKST